HGESQLLSAADGPADYVAIGPVFATLSKQVPDPVVGLEGVRAARAITAKAVSQLPWSDKGREEWFSLGENHERRGGSGLPQLRNRKPVVAIGGISRTNCAAVI